MRPFSIFALGIFVTACGTMYSEPKTGPYANLRVIAKKSEGYFAFTRDITNTCSRDSPTFPMIGGNVKGYPYNLGIPEYTGPKGDRVEQKIVANKPISLTASSLYRAGFGDALFIGTEVGKDNFRKKEWSCNLQLEFTPIEGKNYELQYDFSPNSCQIHLDSLEIENSRVLRNSVNIKTSPANCGTALKGS